MQNTKIEWCDHTFNPWEGCSKVSPGCKHCYAEAMAKRFGKDFGKRRRTSENNWKGPLRWAAAAGMGRFVRCLDCGARETRRLRNGGLDACGNCGRAAADAGMIPARPRVFCASGVDWLDDEVPIEWLADLLDLIRRTPHLDWLLLTKRPGNWKTRVLVAGMGTNYRSHFGDAEAEAITKWISSWVFDGIPPANVWIGASVEDQPRAEERIPEALKIPARVHFLSCEPTLGPVQVWTPEIAARVGEAADRSGIDWVICGGESGPKARPMYPDWARSLRDQCVSARVPFFFKQWGEFAPSEPLYGEDDHDPDHGGCIALEPSGYVVPDRGDRWAYQPAPGTWLMRRAGKKAAGRLLDGREWNEFPNPEL